MAQTQLQERQGNAVQKIDKKYTQRILSETEALVASGRLQLPPDYSAGNAIASAWLMLQEVKDRNGNLALDVCTPISIANALRSMAYLGLSPEKKQCYFVVHGNELTLMRSYFGSMMLAKRLDPDIDEIVAQVVYRGDTVETDTAGGRTVVTMHKTDPFAEHNVADAVGAYCNVIYKDGHYTSTIMTIGQIHKCWDVGHAQRNSPAHRNTPEEMIKRTVIQRACKHVINTSTDTILRDAIRQSDMESARAERDATIAARTNVVEVSFDQKESASAPKAPPEGAIDAEIIEAEIVKEMPAQPQEAETVDEPEPEAEEAAEPEEAHAEVLPGQMGMMLDPVTGELLDEEVPF